ncbi:MAG: porin family protein [Treponema sp.]|nr:porin family protein [Treponema sp.]
MSGKRARFIRKNSSPKKAFSSKKVMALCAGLCLSYAPMAAESEFLVSVFSPFTKPFGEAHQIENGNGAGLKFTFRPAKFFDIFAQGEYLSMQMPGIDPISVLDASVGAGYHFIISDRCSLDVTANGGLYNAKSTTGSVSGFTAGISLGFSYKITPVISVDATASGTHFAANPTPLMMMNAGVSPGITVDVTQIFNKATNVNMQVQELSPVFPALYSWYEKNPFGKVTITNEEDTAITDITVSFYQPQYMAHSKECMNIRKIEKGESVDVDLIAFFNEQMLELKEMSQTNSMVIVNYLYLGQKRSKTFSLDVPVYGRNNMSWDDDRRAAVFVSSKDPAAMHFAKYATSIVRSKKRASVPINIQYAMGIFEALNEFGINYVVDPSSAFADNIGTSSIDFLQFPYQTLMYKGGDCDDLSILVCSLFESVGIKTAFITIPGHIFMAFDSGMNVEQAQEKLRSLGNYIEIDDEVWIPLEITLSDEGFYRAYKYGAREWNKAYSDGTAALYKMHDSWKIYPPISVPGAAEKFTMPANKKISLAFEKSVDQWSFSELKDILNLKPVKLVDATIDKNTDTIMEEASTNNVASVVNEIEDPFSISALVDVLELSGQEIAMNTLTGIKLERRDDDEDDDGSDKDQEPDFDDEYDDDLEEALDFDGNKIPVIAVNVPGPEELGIFVPGKDINTVTSTTAIAMVTNAPAEETKKATQIETALQTTTRNDSVKIDTEFTEQVPNQTNQINHTIETNLTNQTNEINQTIETNVTNQPARIEIAKIDAVVSENEVISAPDNLGLTNKIEPESIASTKIEPETAELNSSEQNPVKPSNIEIARNEQIDVPTVVNGSHGKEHEPKQVPVVPIAIASAFTLGAASGIIIAKKKKKKE